MKKLVISLFVVLLLVGVGNARQATTQYERALINAAKEGNASQVRGLLEAGTNPNVKDENGRTPLYMAAQYPTKDSLVIADMLIYAGTDVNDKTSTMVTPLEVAFYKNNLPVVNRLLTAGANVNVNGFSGKTPLMFAVKTNLDLVNKVLSSGADVNAKDENDGTALIYSFIHIGPEASAIRQRLLKANPDVNVIYRDAQLQNDKDPIYSNATALSYAIADNDIEAVKLLLKHGADVNAPLYHLPLTTALLSKEPGSSKIVELLLNAGANPWTHDFMVADLSACRFKDYMVAEADEKCALITKARAATKAQHTKDDKLYYAAKDGNLKKVQKLLAQGANPNYVNNSYHDTNSPLAVTQSAEVAQALIDAGANVNANNNTSKRTPLFSVNSVEKAKVLIKAGADVNAHDYNNATPLFYAKTVDIAKALINAGASVNAKDNQAHNALVQTKIDKNTEVATFLERYGLTTTNKDARTIEKVHLTQEELDAKHELWKAQQGEEENVGKTFLKGVAEAGAATLQYGIENNKF